MVFLEFEQPLEQLYQQLEKLKEVEAIGDVDVSKNVKDLESKIVKTKEEIYSNLTGWQKVQLSRHPQRPYTMYYVENIFDEFVELHGDRQFKDDKAIVGGMARIGDQRLVVIGHQKGINTKLRQYRNFGMANPEGYRKALRLMKIAERFDIPVLSFIDTPGAYPGLEAEERGQAEAIARNLFEMSQLKVPIVCYVIGEGASGGAIGIGLGDRVFMLQNTWYSVISPESCSSILWRSWDHKEEAAEALRLTPEHMHGFGIIDGIVKEPLGGAHNDPEAMSQILKGHLLEQFKELSKVKTQDLIDQRIERYSSIGKFATVTS